MNILGLLASQKFAAFVGGVLTATVGVKIATSQIVRQAAVTTLAKGMEIKDEATCAIESLKEDAQDIYAEAKMQAGQDGCDCGCSEEVNVQITEENSDSVN